MKRFAALLSIVFLILLMLLPVALNVNTRLVNSRLMADGAGAPIPPFPSAQPSLFLNS